MIRSGETPRVSEGGLTIASGELGASQPDANIDHRRVPNLVSWFQRAGYARPVSRQAADYLPGDLVAWNPGGTVLHIGTVSDRRAITGVPLVIHEIGAGTQEEDVLFRFAIIGDLTGRALRAPFRRPRGA